MLLECPSCGARYEIDGSMIPPTGRRVQCSSCDHVWQENPHVADPSAAASDPTPKAEAESPAAPPPPGDAREPAAGPRRPPLAEDVKAILREEAQREARTRNERGLVELPQGRSAARATRVDRSSRPARGHDETDRNLRAVAEDAAQSRHRRGGTRGGFLAGLTAGLGIVAVAALIYVMAPRLADLVPPAEPTLDAYVRAVENTSVSLDRTLTRTRTKLSDLIASQD